MGSASLCPGQFDIVRIWQNFLASRVAALDCDGVDPATETQFLTTMQGVSLRAAIALKERNPLLADNELTKRVELVVDGVRQNVKADIARNGCGSERVQQLLKLYRLHSRMNLELKALP
ncbi:MULTISPECIES: hypothetical protein [Methylosinus]|uniref:Uncharacterized protein n=1 Tax=Methylosinus trichosporium (strain ATCC 35070 / NCIMB 11131 / UNIQEM 75 / OB3b) TaxID=595536 RepID=A0A2D2CUH7_METT3|nr:MULTISPECIES: hypothetical protein [Methylosinus]ATQ66502.1 hypothetical protein CQW49_00285 [Methylosinus trichosporium OB3b]OBS52658.1 hypothetical protein A8B73_10165 [Methylosinus sp. 3S-1]